MCDWKDAIGNEQSVMNPTSILWYNDINPPTANIAGAPTGTNTTTVLNVAVSSTATDYATYKYKVGLTSTTNCASSLNYLSPTIPQAKITSIISGLADGDITLCVVAIDTIGNIQPLPLRLLLLG